MYSKLRTSSSCLLDTMESPLSVPLELVKKTVGLSLDMGGSVIKFVYRSKENLAEANETTGNIGHLQLVAFPRPDLELALDYVRERCEITRFDDGSKPEIQTTGLGCTLFGKKICDKFNVRLKNITEFDCFLNAFMYLASHLSRKELLYPYDDEAIVEPVEEMKAQLGWIKTTVEDNDFSNSLKSVTFDLDFSGSQGKVVNDSDAPIADTEDLYPCVLAMCGSGFGYMLIRKDKTFSIVEGSNRGGRAFYGIGTLLTGCKNFEELIELATHGNSKNVDVYSDSLFGAENAAEGDSSLYARAAASTAFPALIYSFGKAVHSKLENFRREDLARAWLHYVVNDTAQCLHLVARLHNVKRLFFCGSFCNSALVRKVITAEMIRRNLFASATGSDQTVCFDFIKPGPHLGAIGALICETNSNKSTSNGSTSSSTRNGNCSSSIPQTA